MNMFVFDKIQIRSITALLSIFLSGVAAAQVQNPDAIPLFTRSSVAGTARTAGTGGSFSSVGADLGSMELNPAGLGLYRSSDISITPGLRVGIDQSTYDGLTTKANHTIPQFAQAGAVLCKKILERKGSEPGPFALKFISVGINFQTENSFDRNQNFSAASNSNSLIDNYTYLANKGYVLPDVQLFVPKGLMGQSSPTTFYSNVHAPVQQTGNLSTHGAINKVNLGLGGNLGDKLFFGFSIGVPLLNYTASTQMIENNINPDSSGFRGYQLNTSTSESGIGITGKVGLIYKPAPWVRFGLAYSLPTWYFLSENYSADLQYAFDTIQGEYGGSVEPVNYRIRTPMKGTAGLSFYFKEHGFISMDYDVQNLGSTRYKFTDPQFSGYNSLYNDYLKSAYGVSHIVRIGGEAAIKKLRIRAGYSYTSTPFKKGQNYVDSAHNFAIHSATFGLGLKFKTVYLDLAYVFSYSRDGVSLNYNTPFDPINSTYMTHSLLLTLGFKIGAKNDKNNSAPDKTRRRSNGELPKYLDPGDKPY